MGDALQSLDLEQKNVFVLASSPYKLEALIKPFGDLAVSRLESFFSVVQFLPDGPSAHQIQFQDTQRIDFGEAMLFSATMTLDDFVLVTDDKRSLRALVAETGCANLIQRMNGRVFCVAQLICRCIRRFGFARVKAKVIRALSCDTAIRAAFGSGPESVEENVLLCLNADIAGLRSDTGSLLGP
jgi:hypothetical protein